MCVSGTEQWQDVRLQETRKEKGQEAQGGIHGAQRETAPRIRQQQFRCQFHLICFFIICIFVLANLL